MLKDKNLKIIVPARKGSKRLPNKHFRELNGLPLYRYTFDYLLKNVRKDNVWLNTDDEDLIQIGKDYGFNTLKRPDKFSGDYSPSIDFLLYQKEFFLKNKIYFNAMALIQLTNPFRPNGLIKKAYAEYLVSERDSLTSFSLLKKKVGSLNSNFYTPFNHQPGMRSQDLKQTFFENGLIYIVGENALMQNKIITKDTFPYIIDTHHGDIDIDCEIDLKIAEEYLKLNLIKYDY